VVLIEKKVGYKRVDIALAKECRIGILFRGSSARS
jgi:hypothetical protein